MTSLPLSALLPKLARFAPALPTRAALIRRALARLDRGRLTLELPDGRRLWNTQRFPGPDAVLRINRWRALTRLFLGGDIGFAEGYINGDWDTPDLTQLLRFCAENGTAAARLAEASAPVTVVRRLMKALRRNSRAGSRRNIMAHYDLGNAFFAAWLDPEMIYSSALYTEDDDTLETAQRRKLARITDLTKLEEASSVLEIGCGWGGLAAHLADRGASITGITLSPAQLEIARQRIDERGMADRVRLELRDYRDVQGRYDRIVSIEMFEAVGEAYWDDYFAVIRRSLAPGGRAVLQVITIADADFAHYRTHPDMIQTLVFPGGMLPSRQALADAAGRNGLAIRHAEHFGASYARTLADWNTRFEAAWPDIRGLGYPETLRRLWSFYLAYCRVGFEAGRIDVGLYAIEPMEAEPCAVERMAEG